MMGVEVRLAGDEEYFRSKEIGAVSVGNSLEKVSEDMKRESVLTSWQSRLMGRLFLKSIVLC